jgi:hypothetical protein
MGHGAFLMEQKSPEIFSIRVGNLPPGKSIQILVTYASEVSLEGDGFRFILPTTIAPRYVPPRSKSLL